MELIYFLEGVCVLAAIGIVYGLYLLRKSQKHAV